jgi:hypothetical protein
VAAGYRVKAARAEQVLAVGQPGEPQEEEEEEALPQAGAQVKVQLKVRVNL